MLVLPDKEVILFDLEYTDSSIAEASGILPEIVEIGAVKITSELLIRDRFETLVKPSNMDLYTEFCYNITGIKFADLEKASSFEKVWNDFARFTEFAKCPLVSWGIESDIPILKYSYFRRRLGYPHSKIAIDAKSVVWGFSIINGLNLGGLSLKAVCNYFGIEHNQKHRALRDTLAILAVLKELDKFNGESDEYRLIEL